MLILCKIPLYPQFGYAILDAHCQPRSKDIKWNFPEMKNSQVLDNFHYNWWWWVPFIFNLRECLNVDGECECSSITKNYAILCICALKLLTEMFWPRALLLLWEFPSKIWMRTNNPREPMGGLSWGKPGRMVEGYFQVHLCILPLALPFLANSVTWILMTWSPAMRKKTSVLHLPWVPWMILVLDKDEALSLTKIKTGCVAERLEWTQSEATFMSLPTTSGCLLL